MDTPGSPNSPGETEFPDAITLSEERLRMSLPVRVSGRVRLVKYVETQTVTQTVEVRRERLRVEESAKQLCDDQPNQTAPAEGLAYSWQPQDFDVVLHEERVEILKTVVAVENVHIRTRIVTADQALSVELGREQIELSTSPSGSEIRSEPR